MTSTRKNNIVYKHIETNSSTDNKKPLSYSTLLADSQRQIWDSAVKPQLITLKVDLHTVVHMRRVPVRCIYSYIRVPDISYALFATSTDLRKAVLKVQKERLKLMIRVWTEYPPGHDLYTPFHFLPYAAEMDTVYFPRIGDAAAYLRYLNLPKDKLKREWRRQLYDNAGAIRSLSLGNILEIAVLEEDGRHMGNPGNNPYALKVVFKDGAEYLDEEQICLFSGLEELILVVPTGTEMANFNRGYKSDAVRVLGGSRAEHREDIAKFVKIVEEALKDAIGIEGVGGGIPSRNVW